MIAQINWKPSNIDLKKFGLTIIIGFGLIGAFLGWKKSWEIAFWMWGLSLSLGLLAIFIPPLSKPFYFMWMAIALIMGTVISTVILLIIFYLIITPVGLLMKILGRDPLYLQRKSFKGTTYWHIHPEKFEKEYYRRLF